MKDILAIAGLNGLLGHLEQVVTYMMVAIAVVPQVQVPHQVQVVVPQAQVVVLVPQVLVHQAVQVALQVLPLVQVAHQA